MQSLRSVEALKPRFSAGRGLSQWCEGKASYWRRIKALARALVGAPDYDRYLAHCAAHHPHAVPLARAEFFALRQAARFGRGASRCC